MGEAEGRRPHLPAAQGHLPPECRGCRHPEKKRPEGADLPLFPGQGETALRHLRPHRLHEPGQRGLPAAAGSGDRSRQGGDLPQQRGAAGAHHYGGAAPGAAGEIRHPAGQDRVSLRRESRPSPGRALYHGLPPGLPEQTGLLFLHLLLLDLFRLILFLLRLVL